MVKYSIIIPTYNRSKLLDICLNSLTKQTYSNFEVIVCDDGSSDSTSEVVSKYEDLLMIKYVRTENWGGPARPRNNGITNAEGDWLCFLDSDDLWSDNKLEIIDKYLNNDIDLIYHKMGLFHNNLYKGSKLTLYSRALKENYFKDLLLNGNVINNSSVVVRKEIMILIGGVCEEKEMIGCEDYNTWLKISFLSSKIYYIPKVLGYYNKHSDGISRNDMSIPHTSAVNEFLNFCSDLEKAQIAAHIKYMKCIYLFYSTSRANIYSDILYCVKNGKFIIKIKSIFLMLRYLLKHV